MYERPVLFLHHILYEGRLHLIVLHILHVWRSVRYKAPHCPSRFLHNEGKVCPLMFHGDFTYRWSQTWIYQSPVCANSWCAAEKQVGWPREATWGCLRPIPRALTCARGNWTFKRPLAFSLAMNQTSESLSLVRPQEMMHFIGGKSSFGLSLCGVYLLTMWFTYVSITVKLGLLSDSKLGVSIGSFLS